MNREHDEMLKQAAANAVAVALLPALLVIGGGAMALAAVRRRWQRWPWPDEPVRVDDFGKVVGWHLPELSNDDIDRLLKTQPRRRS